MTEGGIFQASYVSAISYKHSYAAIFHIIKHDEILLTNYMYFIGVVGLIKADMVKPGACIIDVGITRITLQDGTSKLVGDVDYEGTIFL